MSAQVEYGFVEEPKGKTAPLFTQVHGSALIEITHPEDKEQHQRAPLAADGAWTRSSGVELYVFTADCLPILFYGEQAGDPIAAVHCGWRGALSGIARKAAERLAVPRLHAVLGPAILDCCFEVKEDFVEAFEQAGRPIHPFLRKRGERLFCDLVGYVREVELSTVAPHRLHTETLRCTYCSTPSLPSYRRNKSTDPRIRSWIRRVNPYFSKR